MIDVVTNGAGDAWGWEWVSAESSGTHLLATSAPLYLSEYGAHVAAKIGLNQCRDWPIVDRCEA